MNDLIKYEWEVFCEYLLQIVFKREKVVYDYKRNSAGTEFLSSELKNNLLLKPNSIDIYHYSKKIKENSVKTSLAIQNSVLVRQIHCVTNVFAVGDFIN